MGFFDNDSKQKKNNLIALQNIVLEIDEKKLQVSEEFLDKMTKIYISKYMKNINEIVCDINKLTNIGLLFKKYDAIMSNLNELIKIEPLYRFNKPVPTEFKAQLESNLTEYCNSLISREWKKVSAASDVKRNDPNQEKKMIKFFDTFELYEERLPKASLKLLEKLHSSAFPEKEKKDEKPHLTDFVPEEFEKLEAPIEESQESEDMREIE